MTVDLHDHYARFPDDMTLGQARAIMREQLAKGAPCPVCTKNTKLYLRPLNAGHARALARLYAIAGRNWVHKPTALKGFGAAARDESLLRHWGLLEPAPGAVEGSQKSGVWRVTALGEQWLRGEVAVVRRIKEFNGRMLGFVEGDPEVSYRDVLGMPFDLDAMLQDIGTYRDSVLALPRHGGVIAYDEQSSEGELPSDGEQGSEEEQES